MLGSGIQGACYDWLGFWTCLAKRGFRPRFFFKLWGRLGVGLPVGFELWDRGA